MKVKHSLRYLEIQKKISHLTFSLKEAINFLLTNNREKTKKNKVSFFLENKKNKNKLNLEKKRLFLPFFSDSRKKIMVLSEGLEKNLIEKCQLDDSFLVFNNEQLKSFWFKNEKFQKKKTKEIKYIISKLSNEENIKFLQKELSSKGLFPNKKNGFLTENVKELVEKKPEIIKVDKDGNINLLLGNNLNDHQLLANFQECFRLIVSLRPDGWKGEFIKKIVLSTTMGPGISITPS